MMPDKKNFIIPISYARELTYFFQMKSINDSRIIRVNNDMDLMRMMNTNYGDEYIRLHSKLASYIDANHIYDLYIEKIYQTIAEKHLPEEYKNTDFKLQYADIGSCKIDILIEGGI